MISIDVDLSMLQNEIANLRNENIQLRTELNNVKSAIFGQQNVPNDYLSYNDNLSTMRQRLNFVEQSVMSNGEPLYVIKQKVTDMQGILSWVQSMTVAHNTTIKKFEDIDMDNIKEVVNQLKSIVENLNGIVEDPRFQNELERMNELISRMGD